MEHKCNCQQFDVKSEYGIPTFSDTLVAGIVQIAFLLIIIAAGYFIMRFL